MPTVILPVYACGIGDAPVRYAIVRIDPIVAADLARRVVRVAAEAHADQLEYLIVERPDTLAAFANDLQPAADALFDAEFPATLDSTLEASADDYFVCAPTDAGVAAVDAPPVAVEFQSLRITTGGVVWAVTLAHEDTTGETGEIPYAQLAVWAGQFAAPSPIRRLTATWCEEHCPIPIAAVGENL